MFKLNREFIPQIYTWYVVTVGHNVIRYLWSLFVSIKNYIKKLSYLGIEINYALDDGISIFGVNLSKVKHSYDMRSGVALNRCRKFKPNNVLDVGSGGGEHASAFLQDGAEVTCIDFGTSIYATEAEAKEVSGIRLIKADFVSWDIDQKYDLVWASHVLEHQRDVGTFVEKLISCCEENGRIAITVPTPHRNLWGGHLTLWSPGLLAYNIVLCGIDLSSAELFYGYREVSIIFSPIYISLPELTHDSGDLYKLQKYLPQGFGENSDALL